MIGKFMEHPLKCWYPIMCLDMHYALQQHYECRESNTAM